MGIPPHAARLAGAWAVKSATDPQSEPTPGHRSGSPTDPEPSPAPAVAATGAPTRRLRRDRSPHTAVSRILHPLNRHA